MAAEPGELALASGGGAATQQPVGQQVLNTPRTREACRRLGLVLEDLQYRDKSEFALPGDIKEKQLLRYEHNEKRRKKWLGDVLAERAKVIAQDAQRGNAPGVQSGQFLSMLESLFDKEAKRLEADLKGQLRQHSSLVKENEEQLKKESQLQAKLMDCERKKVASADHYQVNNGLSAKVNRERRTAKAVGNRELVETERIERHAKMENERLAEEERLEKFREDKVQNCSDQTGLFRARVEAMKEKRDDMRNERIHACEQRLQDMDRKMLEVQARREEDAKLRQVRSEEQHLHLMDVRESKNRIERVEGYRRDELRGQVEGNIERIETLLALKDQLLDQRKARNMKQDATKGSRGLNLRRDCLPGPGQYEAPQSTLLDAKSSKIGKEARVGIPDERCEANKHNPPPGYYDVKVMANGKSVDTTSKPLKFSDRQRESYLDQAIREKATVPAPGVYESMAALEKRGAVIVRDKIQDQGLDKYSAKRLPTWQRPATETPGPAGYNTDAYLRKEVLRRAQRSLPDLTRDMLSGPPVVTKTR
jgi:hypothetical protein